MRIIEKYINFSIFKIFLTTSFIFCLLYILIDVTSNLDEVIDRKVPFQTFLLYYSQYVPIILVQTSSIACLVATLFTYSSMNNTNEIVALRASGMNFWQITKPALVFGILISTVVFWLNESYVPKATIATRKIRIEQMLRKEKSEVRMRQKIENLTFYGLRNRLYFVDTYNPRDAELEGITIIEYDEEQNIEQKIVALSGKWTGLAWKFFNCQITTFEKAGEKTSATVKVYKEKLMNIKETPGDFLRQRLNVNSMNIQQLNDYINRFSKSGANKALNNLRVDLHQKIAYPFGNFVIVLVGLPFALMIKSRKRSSFASFGIAIVIGFLYYILNAVCLAFGKGGALPPILSAWAAPLIVTGIAVFVIESNF